MIYVIIPTYNEEDNILKLISKLQSLPLDIRIIIVDDSTKKLKNLTKIKKTEYYYRGKKLGRGSAVLFGIKKALRNKKLKILIEMDADFSHNPNEIIKNLKYFNKNKLNFLIASRYLKKSKIINWPFSRHLLSKFSNFLARFLLNIPIKDYTNGFRFYDKIAAKHVYKKCYKSKSSGFILLSEIAMEMYIHKFKMDEIDTIFINRTRGESKASFSEIVKSFFGLLNLYYKYKILKNTT